MAHFRPILNHFALTDQQWRILRVLDEYGQLEPREICSQCQIHSASMAGMLARMEELALVQRNRMAEDQRRVGVRLAPKGEQLVSEIAPLIDAQYEMIEDALGVEVLDTLFNALETFLSRKSSAVARVQLSAPKERISDEAHPLST